MAWYQHDSGSDPDPDRLRATLSGDAAVARTFGGTDMRRLRLLLAGALAAGMVAAWSGVVYADQPAAGGFCDQFEGFVDDLEATDVGDIDFTDPEATQEIFGQAAEAYGELEDEAPKKLKKSFKTVRKYYENLADEELDFSDPEALQDFVPSGKVAKAFGKVSEFISSECGVDVTGEDVGS
jgi:hypothetical protein